jgi:hypothetical protein
MEVVRQVAAMSQADFEQLKTSIAAMVCVPSCIDHWQNKINNIIVGQAPEDHADVWKLGLEKIDLDFLSDMAKVFASCIEQT